jgi:mono/diheme cytochrome c family protein
MHVRRALLITAALLLAIAIAVLWRLNHLDEAGIAADAPPLRPTAAQIERGAYLARAGNCAACHTARGGEPYAGGRGIETPFGTVFAGNLTPDVQTGIGRWSADEFWRALHNGRSRDGRFLYPAFPYPEFTRIKREDADAIFAFLQSLPAAQQPSRPHALRFPYDNPLALVIWRALYFRPTTFADDPTHDAAWNRGAYLVRGLGHCNACHASRNLLGATLSGVELGGGLIPMQNWYAPSLASPLEAGVADWNDEQVIALLKHGVSPRGSVLGPMAEVVFRSTQHLNDADLHAMATFLRAVPPAAPAASTPTGETVAPAAADSDVMRSGERIYATNCAGCHGDHGEGAVTPAGAPAYPTLAGNRAVTMDPPANLIRVVATGGFAPTTTGNPQPFGMPPFSQALSDAEVAAVITYIRGSFGNRAGEVTLVTLQQFRGGMRD